MDFEEFMTLSQSLYKKAGGKMVANKRKGKFDKTRNTVDVLKERVNRNNLTIDHLKHRLEQMELQAQVPHLPKTHAHARHLAIRPPLSAFTLSPAP